jgi:hypothetical protein
VRPSLWILFICLLTTVPSFGQTQPPRPIPQKDVGNTPFDEDEARNRITREMAKKANEQREAALKNDTDKLLKLATELKAYVDKSDKNVLSLDVVKKAEEIEKLAHSDKDKMKGPT